MMVYRKKVYHLQIAKGQSALSLCLIPHHSASFPFLLPLQALETLNNYNEQKRRKQITLS